MSSIKPTVLIVLDGWGHADPSAHNAVTSAPAHNFLRWREEWPNALLSASGKEVGLPLGLMGNSEVGHTNIGAGRTVRQTITRIDRSVKSGEFTQLPAIRGAIEHARSHGTNLHLFGLIGPGGVHASDQHWNAVLEMAHALGLPSNQIRIHAILDGRDTPPTSGAGFMEDLDNVLEKYGGEVASLSGRYWGMDRDQNWERIEKFWRASVLGKAERTVESWSEALALGRTNGETDEFLAPTLINRGVNGIKDGDAVFSINFRADRVRQITEAFLVPTFSGFDRETAPEVYFASMTRYRDDFSCPVAFPKEELRSLFGELVSAKGLRQFRCAETEKYAHVTFFFNGGREQVYEGEERHLVPSPKVATYDLKPEMSAQEVTNQVCQRLEAGQHHLYVVNFANSDMVGHTGIQSAAEAAVSAVDRCLGRIAEKVFAAKGTMAITADHGNAEMMVNPDTGDSHTAHTLNPVPFLLMGEKFRGGSLREMGVLADVAPTLMQTMGIEQPDVMDGQSLIQR
ncbi:MAG TPA: 2,3-bisphosphoglycerate-independent phosphoglycerate mutase [Planctomycetes bacterium]|nr:2,3-bisphosphoglycerate-independent phosphoglycerate mutase [Planctomycetota bacterium]